MATHHASGTPRRSAAKTAKKPRVLLPGDPIFKCGHDVIYLEPTQDGDWLCWKCQVLASGQTRGTPEGVTGVRRSEGVDIINIQSTQERP
jgi:hypothetical protein